MVYCLVEVHNIIDRWAHTKYLIDGHTKYLIDENTKYLIDENTKNKLKKKNKIIDR